MDDYLGVRVYCLRDEKGHDPYYINCGECNTRILETLLIAVRRTNPGHLVEEYYHVPCWVRRCRRTQSYEKYPPGC